MNIPRPEYPRPQFVRSEWLCLNGEWQFEIDNGDSGLDRGLLDRELNDRILVPFCPESSLSGIGNTDFMLAVWYRRTVTIPANWTNQRILLHFQAVDYDTTVWVNGVEVGRHRGGFTPFTCDLGASVKAGETITLVVRARDDYHPVQPRGKQSQRYYNYTCFYTRTTGIWQTVWLEPVPSASLRRPRITPDVANSMFRIEQQITNVQPGMKLTATLRDAAGVVSTATCAADLDFSPRLDLPISAERRRLWSIQNPHLYDLDLTLSDVNGEMVDHISSYAGLRNVTIQGKAIKINGEVIFQRLVLDQGYYPDGIMTAPTEEALVRDIELSVAAGFNGARLHQKVFEERFLYHADKMGYIVWGEFADWGFDKGRVSSLDSGVPTITYAAQWLEAIERDYSHPSIIGWCPFNENIQHTQDRITTHDDALRALFLATKALDTTRPVLDISGYSHRVPESDLYDSHDYLPAGEFQQELGKFKERHGHLSEGKAFTNQEPNHEWSIPYRGQPYFVSEFGGLWWNPELEKPGGVQSSWGYGTAPKSTEEFYERFEGLCAALLDNPNMFGYCYTQLTDVFIEQNGIYLFDRRPKFDLERIRKIQTRPAKIEQQ